MDTGNENFSKKICIVSISLGGGGAERSTAILSQMLESLGHTVHIVITKDAVDYPFAGSLLNLGVYKKGTIKILRIINRLLIFKKYLKKHHFDFIIDNRTRSTNIKELIYLKYLYKNIPLIYVVRSAELKMYFPSWEWIAKKMIQKSVHIIGVSKGIAIKINKYYRTEKAIFIYNPITINNEIPFQPVKKPFAIFVGRLDQFVKNFTLLLEAYKMSTIWEKGVHLKIFGKGPDETFILEEIKRLHLENFVTLEPFTSNILPCMKAANFLALTSRFEGFPRVLIEALSVGTPVVSVDCETGPSEIISHNHNGLLVENNNVTKLANAFSSMIDDKILYNKLKNNSIASIQEFSTEKISAKWQVLLNE
ncbi:MAG: glycosyltransferase [Flavobacteriaceae bacterium]